jgi:hypothetical protein
MKIRVAHLLAGAALVLGCSDATTPPADGSFELSGVLVEGTDSVGTLGVSGAFSAELLQ